jgi:hypothetical protein
MLRRIRLGDHFRKAKILHGHFPAWASKPPGYLGNEERSTKALTPTDCIGYGFQLQSFGIDLGCLCVQKEAAGKNQPLSKAVQE